MNELSRLIKSLIHAVIHNENGKQDNNDTWEKGIKSTLHFLIVTTVFQLTSSIWFVFCLMWYCSVSGHFLCFLFFFLFNFFFFSFFLARIKLASVMTKALLHLPAASAVIKKKKRKEKRHLWLSQQSSEPFVKPVCNKRKAKAICKKINKGKVFSICHPLIVLSIIKLLL